MRLLLLFGLAAGLSAQVWTPPQSPALGSLAAPPSMTIHLGYPTLGPIGFEIRHGHVTHWLTNTPAQADEFLRPPSPPPAQGTTRLHVNYPGAGPLAAEINTGGVVHWVAPNPGAVIVPPAQSAPATGFGSGVSQFMQTYQAEQARRQQQEADREALKALIEALRAK